MRKDCNTPYYPCRSCTAAKTLPRSQHRLGKVRAKRQFVRVQIDLYEVSPGSDEGYNMVLTLHCVYSRYPHFRELRNGTAIAVAEALWDATLDMGVVPPIIQIGLGKEFVNEIMSELVQLLGSTQAFSSAVHRQTQVIGERSHRDVTALLSMLLQSFVIVRPTDWDRQLRVLECRLRDWTLGKSGCTPRSVVYGWYSTTPLQSALDLIDQMPPDLPFNERVRELVADQREMAYKWEEWRHEQDEKEDEYWNEQNVRTQAMQPGQLVLLRKGDIER